MRIWKEGGGCLWGCGQRALFLEWFQELRQSYLNFSQLSGGSLAQTFENYLSPSPYNPTDPEFVNGPQELHH